MVEKNAQDSRLRIWIDAQARKWLSFDELNTWLGMRCRVLWSKIRHPEYKQFSVADMLKQERSESMPMPSAFDGYVERTQRAMALVRHQMKAAKFPLHRDLAGFDFEAAKVDQRLVKQLATLEFTDTAQNAVLIVGPGTAKTHLAIVIGVAGIAAKGKRVRFYSTVDLVNELEKEKPGGKPGRIAQALLRLDLVTLDPLNQSSSGADRLTWPNSLNPPRKEPAC